MKTKITNPSYEDKTRTVVSVSEDTYTVNFEEHDYFATEDPHDFVNGKSPVRKVYGYYTTETGDTYKGFTVVVCAICAGKRAVKAFVVANYFVKLHSKASRAQLMEFTHDDVL